MYNRKKKQPKEDGDRRNRDKHPARIYPLTPDDRLDESADGADYAIYEQYLEGVFLRPELHNIAVTGNYGVGKSSIIRTFDRKRNQNRLRRRHFLYISLASFCAGHPRNEGEEGPEGGLKKTLEELEQDLLRQILYVCDDIRRVPGITYRLIPSPKSRLKRCIPGIMLTLLAACLFLTAFGSQLYAGVEPFLPMEAANWCGSHHQVLAAVPYGLIFLCLLFFVRMLAGWLSGGAHLSKLTLEGSSKAAGLDKIGVDIQPVEGTSYLDRHGFELIYVLERMADRFDHTVVFEDMDMLGPDVQRELFSELREINCLANSRLSYKWRPPQCLRKLPVIGDLSWEPCLRFVYVAHDMEFAPRDCSKFFDYILPVIPVISGESLADRLAETYLKGVGITLDEQAEDESWRPSSFLACASPELNDYRTVHTILNEYRVFEQVEEKRGLVMTQAEKRDLFTFVTYKNLCPEDYYGIRTGESAVFPPPLGQRDINRIQSSLIRDWLDKGHLPWDCILFAGYSLTWLRETYTAVLAGEDEGKKRRLLQSCADGRSQQRRLCADILLDMNDESFEKAIKGISLSIATYLLCITPVGAQNAEKTAFEERFQELIKRAEAAARKFLDSDQWPSEQSAVGLEKWICLRFGALSFANRSALIHYLLLCDCELEMLDVWLLRKDADTQEAADIWRFLGELPPSTRETLLKNHQETAFQWISSPAVLRGLREAGENSTTLSLAKMMIPPGKQLPSEVGEMTFSFVKGEAKSLRQWLNETPKKGRRT